MIRCQNYIGGRWVPPTDEAFIESINPATGDVVSTAPCTSLAQLREAISMARRAFETSTWAEDSQLRTRVLNEYAYQIRQRIDELGKLLTDENGKILADAKYEVDRGAGILEYYAGMAQNVFGHTALPFPNFFSFVLREPIGVVGLVVPFNFPVVLLLRSLAPALAAGNAVVVKPSSYTPGITYEMMKIFSKIEGVPPGIVNLISCSGAMVGPELCANPDVDMIALTGSSTTGKKVMSMAADSLTRVSLELGGKSPNVVLKDANLKKAARHALKGAWLSYGGQVCYAGTRILLEKEIHSEFVDILKTEAEGLKLGYGAKDGVNAGPVISKEQLTRVLDYIEVGKREADLVTGGFRVSDGELSKGNFVAPTVFDNVPVDARISNEEIFGPVLSVSPFQELEEAVRIANSTKFGLAGAVWTQDIDKAFWLARRIKAGTVWINSYGKLPYQAEMGGYKESGIGRQYGVEGLYEFTQLKHIAVDIGQ